MNKAPVIRNGSQPPEAPIRKRATICVGVVLFLLCLAAEPRSANGWPRDSQTQEPSIKVESNLVLVPVFVYAKYGLQPLPSKEEKRCLYSESSLFYSLSADQSFSPRDCAARVVKDLTPDDFRLFEDGQLRRVETVARQSWALDVRDNRTWHIENSDTPQGIWSSSDLDHSFMPGGPPFYYILGYVPGEADRGCHRIRVEVVRPNTQVFSRDEYCAGQSPSNLLKGTKIGDKLERELSETGHGNIPVSAQAGVVPVGNKQVEDVVLEFPWQQLTYSADVTSGRFYIHIGILGAVYSREGKIVTRFSDLLWPSYWPTVVMGWATSTAFADRDLLPSYLSHWKPVWLPTRYETQFDLAPGDYDLRIVLSDGSKVGRVEMPLTVEDYQSEPLALSSVFLCNRFRDAHVAEIETKEANFVPQYVPLVSKAVRVTPAGDMQFESGDLLSAYFEIYDQQLAANHAPRIQANLRIVDTKGDVVKQFGAVDATTYEQPSSVVVPIAREIPIAKLRKGEYRLEVQASDSAGRITPWKAASFTIH